MPRQLTRWHHLTFLLQQPGPKQPPASRKTGRSRNTAPSLTLTFFVPVAIETLGPINDKGLEFIADLDRHLTQATGEPRESSFFFQRLSITIQRFNAVAFSGSFVKPAIDTDEG